MTPPLSASLHRTGVILVSTAGLISLTAILSLCTYLGYQLSKKTAPASIRSLKSQFGVLYSGLLFADTLQSIAFTLSLSRLAVFLNSGDVGSAWFNILIALHTVFLVTQRRKPPSWAIGIGVGFTLSLMLVTTLVGPFAVQNSAGGPFYNNTGYWCWIDGYYDAARLYLHYIWVFLAAIISIIAYCLVFSMLFFRKKFPMAGQQTASKRLDDVAKKMLFFPVVYLFSVLPLAIARCMSYAGDVVPWRYLLFAGIVFALNGIFNVILFGLSHRLIAFKGVRNRSGVSTTMQTTLASTVTLPVPRPSMISRQNSSATLKGDAIGVHSALRARPKDEEFEIHLGSDEDVTPLPILLDVEGHNVAALEANSSDDA